MTNDDFDYFNNQKLLELFKGKTPAKMFKYIRTLAGLDSAIEKNYKLLKRDFNDKESYYKFLRENLLWFLEKSKYDFSEDEVTTIMNIL